MGSFNGINAKNVSGMVKVGGQEIALSGFKSAEAPELHIFLTKGTNEVAVQASTNGATRVPVWYQIFNDVILGNFSGFVGLVIPLQKPD